MANKVNSSINPTYFNNRIMSKEEFETQKEDKLLLSNIINCMVQTDNIVEFNNNVRFFDSKPKILTPTIAEEYATEGRKATLITPNFQKSFKNNDLTIVKCNLDNPFGEYQDLITPKMIRKIEEAKCFVASSNIPGLDKRFKAWAGMGIPCIYTVTGFIDSETTKMDSTITNTQNFMDGLTKGNNLSIEESSIQCGKKVHKVYLLKR